MVITGIEVIRGNHTSSSASTDIAPGQKIELTYGEKLRVSTSLEFQGQAQKVTLYGSIGARSALAGFDEILASEVTVNLPASPTSFSLVPASLDIPITADIAPKTNYDLYVKLKEYPDAGKPEVDDVIDIAGMPPTFTLLEETIYPYAYIYDGKYEKATFTFRSDPFTPANWVASRLAAHVEDEVKKAGGRVMAMRVYVDQTPLLWSDWRIEVEEVPPATTAGLALDLGIGWIAIAILAALAIVLIIVLTWSVKTIVSTFTHKPISEEVKAAWSRETLIGAIGDFEKKLKRTPTPVATLQEKTDQELRDYCDELAKAIAPPAPGIGLALVAVGAGVLVLGAGAAIAMGVGKPK